MALSKGNSVVLQDEIMKALGRDGLSMSLVQVLQGFLGKMTQGRTWEFGKKMQGHAPVTLLSALVLLPFVSARSVVAGVRRIPDVWYEGKKDALYDFLRNPRICWRDLLRVFVLKLIRETAVGVAPKESYFIIDDTIIAKRGKTMEGISRLYDPSNKRHVLGYSAVVLGWLSGKRLFVLDGLLCAGQNRPEESLAREGERYPKLDGRTILGDLKMKALKETKLALAREMLSRNAKHFQATHVLMDSWYMAKDLITHCRTLNLHVTGRVKMDKRKFFIDGKEMTLAEIEKSYVTKCKRLLKRIDVQAKAIRADLLGVGPVVLVFCSRLPECHEGEISSKKGKAVLLSTDPSDTAEKVIRRYAQRWSIEIAFKTMKQYLGFNKEEVHTFAGRFAATIIGLMRYNIIAYLRYRDHSFDATATILEKAYALSNAAVMTDKLWVFIKKFAVFLSLKGLDEESIYKTIRNAVKSLKQGDASPMVSLLAGAES